jgi:hypothetical protein
MTPDASNAVSNEPRHIREDAAGCETTGKALFCTNVHHGG